MWSQDLIQRLSIVNQKQKGRRDLSLLHTEVEIQRTFKQLIWNLTILFHIHQNINYIKMILIRWVQVDRFLIQLKRWINTTIKISVIMNSLSKAKPEPFYQPRSLNQLKISKQNSRKRELTNNSTMTIQFSCSKTRISKRNHWNLWTKDKILSWTKDKKR